MCRRGGWRAVRVRAKRPAGAVGAGIGKSDFNATRASNRRNAALPSPAGGLAGRRPPLRHEGVGADSRPSLSLHIPLSPHPCPSLPTNLPTSLPPTSHPPSLPSTSLPRSLPVSLPPSLCPRVSPRPATPPRPSLQPATTAHVHTILARIYRRDPAAARAARKARPPRRLGGGVGSPRLPTRSIKIAINIK